MHAEGFDYPVLAPVHVNKEPLPPRHRRKRRDEETTINSPQPPQNPTRDPLMAREPEFDLEDSAFPPLPGKPRKIFVS